MEIFLGILILAIAGATLQKLALGFFRAVGYVIMFIVFMTWIR